MADTNLIPTTNATGSPQETKHPSSKPRHSEYWTRDRIMKLIIGLALAGSIVWLLDYLSHALLPFFVACLIAYLLQPLVEFNRRWTHEKGRLFSSILTIVEVTAFIALCLYLLLPSVIKEFDTLDTIVKDITEGRRQLPEEFTGLITFVNSHFNIAAIKESLSSMQFESLLSRGSSLLTESLEVLGQLLDWALTLVYVLFILIDYPQIVRGFKLIIPYKYRSGTLEVIRDMQVSMNHYFRGQGMVALCATVFYCVGFSIVGLPLAVPLGLLVGILYMIPYFQYITIIPLALICFIYSLGGTVSFMSIFIRSLLVYAVTQPVCDFIITPRIMGKELGLNAAVILLSLSVWGSLLGIIGMIIALPVTSLIMSYYEQYISNPRIREEVEESEDTQAD